MSMTVPRQVSVRVHSTAIFYLADTDVAQDGMHTCTNIVSIPLRCSCREERGGAGHTVSGHAPGVMTYVEKSRHHKSAARMPNLDLMGRSTEHVPLWYHKEKGGPHEQLRRMVDGPCEQWTSGSDQMHLT